jgi:hypothetical protein
MTWPKPLVEIRTGLVVRKVRNCAQWNEIWNTADDLAVACADDLIDYEGHTSVYLLDGVGIEDIAVAMSSARAVLGDVHCLVVDSADLAGLRVDLDAAGDTGCSAVNDRHCTILATTVGELRALAFATYQQVKGGVTGSADRPGQRIVNRIDVARRGTEMLAAAQLGPTKPQASGATPPTFDKFRGDLSKQIEKDARRQAELAAKAQRQTVRRPPPQR